MTRKFPMSFELAFASLSLSLSLSPFALFTLCELLRHANNLKLAPPSLLHYTVYNMSLSVFEKVKENMPSFGLCRKE